MEIKKPAGSDWASVETVLRAAFSTDAEARLVRLLVDHGKDAVSLAAVIGEQVVGHIIFSPATLEREPGQAGRLSYKANGLGLAPLAVLPEFQRRGIGSALARAGLEACRALSAPWVVVLGEPAYYGRFGFVPASRYGLTGEFGGDAFQVLVFEERQMPAGGNVRYASEFRKVFGGEG